MAVTAAALSAAELRRQNHQSWWYAYAASLLVTAAIAGMAVRSAPHPFTLALVVVLAGAAVCVVRPVAGVYLVVTLAILGDGATAPWYPFIKNFSSAESLLYLDGKLVFSPLELLLGALVVGWVLQMLTTRQWVLIRGRLFRPLMVFTTFLFLGLMYGLATGGDRTAALSEIRAILYLPLLYVLVTNLFDRARQYHRLFWGVMAAVVVNGVVAVLHDRTLTPAEKLDLNSLVDHPATLAMNALFVFILAAWFFRGSSPAKRWLVLAIAPVVAAYIISERRAAFVALIAALIVLCVVLHWTDRARFWIVAPCLLMITVLYLGAFWNSSSGIGYPAQAVKSVVAPEELDDRDQSSGVYRVVESQNIVFTIRTNPVLGIGFGQQFLRPYNLPGITTFALNNYVTHNSVLWIWMKAGIGGFVAMLFLFGATLRAGARAILASTDPDDRVIAVTAVAFVVMYAVFAYVDIGWDPRSMVLLAIAMAKIDSVALLGGERSGTAEPRGALDRPAPAIEAAR